MSGGPSPSRGGDRARASLPVRSAPWILLAIGLVRITMTLASDQANLAGQFGYDSIDLAVYRLAGQAVLDEIPLYGEGYFPDWLPFTYPPFAAVLFVPLALVPRAAAQGLMALASIASLGVSAWLVALRAPTTAGVPLPWSRPVLACGLFGLGATLQPTSITLDLGQINLVLMAMLLTDGLVPWRFQGALTGIATGIKIVPGIFVLAMWFSRRWREVACATVAFVVTIVVGSFVQPRSSWLYWTTLFFDEERQGSLTTYLNQSLYADVQRVTGEAGGLALWAAVALPLVAVGMVVSVRLWRVDPLVATVAVALTGLLASPISWDHHWVWLMPAIAVVAALGVRARGQQGGIYPSLCSATAVGCFLLSVGGPIKLATGSSRLPVEIANWFLANGLMLSGIACLVLIGVASLRIGGLWPEAPMPAARESSAQS